LETIMSWTVACFCGNVYTAPPDRCDVCHKSLDHATEETASADETQRFAASVVTDTNPGPQEGHSSPGWAVIPAGR
jgi:predicted pyridoxine 5'-phosphate oxidase superfamily flavin-nucleotide-binding protein